MKELPIQLENELHKHFGFKEFKLGQKEIIESILSGKHTLATLPTGSGKSICYQLPSLILEGSTIVISPLISLMVDQVKRLKSQGYKRVTALNSLLSFEQKMKIIHHLDRYRLIYCSPEMLQQSAVINRLKQLNIKLFVVDEAHCISQWGHEFRPDYLRLKQVIQDLNEPTVLALSATATPKIQDEIVTYLSIDMNKIIYPMDRVNITYNVIPSKNQQEKRLQLTKMLTNVNAPTMIYFSSRAVCEQVCFDLKSTFPDRAIAFYHGGMEQEERLLIQQQFMIDQLDIICCTSAFGMGVNKDNIRLVIHYHLPPNLESFIQETGRSGRDGNHSISVLLYTHGDETLVYQLIDNEFPTDLEIEGYVKDRSSIKDYLSENKVRFLEYQVEDHLNESVDDAIKRIQQRKVQRKQVKASSANQLVNWIHTTYCRRVTLFEPYQETVRQASYDCCDQCGFNVMEWHLEEKNVTHNELLDWRNMLEDMLIRR